MPVITVVLAAVSAAVVFAIAAGAVGREAHRLDALAPRVVYRLDDAVEFVAAALPAATQARLTFDELETLLREHLNWLAGQGLQSPGVVDARQDLGDVVVDPRTVVAHLLPVVEERGVKVLDDVDVVRVVEAHHDYLATIGAVGSPAGPLRSSC